MMVSGWVVLKRNPGSQNAAGRPWIIMPRTFAYSEKDTIKNWRGIQADEGLDARWDQLCVWGAVRCIKAGVCVWED